MGEVFKFLMLILVERGLWPALFWSMAMAEILAIIGVIIGAIMIIPTPIEQEAKDDTEQTESDGIRRF
jgi:hypothetical protein